MTYALGFSSQRSGGNVAETTVSNARQAVEAIRGLEASYETLRYIKLSSGHEIGVRELERHADRESSLLVTEI